MAFKTMKKVSAKGKWGLILEERVLKTRYNINYKPKNAKYDLPLALNSLTRKNVSVKSTRTNSINCGSIFNFLSSTSLELIVIQYSLLAANSIRVELYYLFNNLDTFFIRLNATLDLVLLYKLAHYMKELKYPFSKSERSYCHKIAKLVTKKSFCDFRVNCKLSRKNKRIQCSLKLGELVKCNYPEYLHNNLDIES
jgi:hypothetical protein